MENFLIDLDGTIYSGDVLIDHAKTFIDFLNANKGKYIFITNCPLRNPDRIVDKLRRLGLDIASDSVISSGVAAAEYIQENHKGERVFLIGSEDLRIVCDQYGIMVDTKDVNVVLVGFDPEFTYEKLKIAVRCISEGAKYIVTNLDATIPEGMGFIPHTGAIAASITEATGVKPLCIGKPSGYLLDMAMRKFCCTRNKIAVIGDRIDTDMRFALNCNVAGYLVLTGITKRSDLISIDLGEKITVVDSLMQIIHNNGGKAFNVR